MSNVLPAAVEGATHTPLTITWTREDGTAQNLTGATITARIKMTSEISGRDATGTLSISDAESGIFTWTFSTADVSVAGNGIVQFIATYGDATADKTLHAQWSVVKAI